MDSAFGVVETYDARWTDGLVVGGVVDGVPSSSPRVQGRRDCEEGPSE